MPLYNNKLKGLRKDHVRNWEKWNLYAWMLRTFYEYCKEHWTIYSIVSKHFYYTVSINRVMIWNVYELDFVLAMVNKMTSHILFGWNSIKKFVKYCFRMESLSKVE